MDAPYLEENHYLPGMSRRVRLAWGQREPAHLRQMPSNPSLYAGAIVTWKPGGRHHVQVAWKYGAFREAETVGVLYVDGRRIAWHSAPEPRATLGKRFLIAPEERGKRVVLWCWRPCPNLRQGKAESRSS